jgi:hypothetical protein
MDDIYNPGGERLLGRIGLNDYVDDSGEHTVGRVTDGGDIYRGDDYVGEVTSGGNIRSKDGGIVGEVRGTSAYRGGPATPATAIRESERQSYGGGATLAGPVVVRLEAGQARSR